MGKRRGWPGTGTTRRAIALFGDLIYVYAISRLTTLVSEPVGGAFILFQLARYLAVCLVILQAWLYLTSYVDRYGRWRPSEFVLVAANLTAVLYVASTLTTSFDALALTFNLAMMVALACVGALYALVAPRGPDDPAAARNSLLSIPILNQS